MKRLSILLLFLIPFLSIAQKEKEIKPSLPKAEKALKENKLDEAKSIIDVTTASQDFMVDKKGQPTKSAAKAWFLKGLIYAAIDTTNGDQFKNLEAHPFDVAKESFDKSKQLDGGNTPFYVTDASGFPILNENVFSFLAQAYFTKAVAQYQEVKDYKKALEATEQTLYFIPGDTSVLLNAGVFFAPAADEDDKAIVFMKEYLAKGGTSPDPYVMMFGIYRDKKKDMESALKIAQEGMVRHPNHPEFPKYELDVFVKTNRLLEAKEAMEKQANADPSDKESRYFLGIINQELYNNISVGTTTEEMAIRTFGEPKTKNKTTTSSGTEEQWVYDGINLHFANGKLKAFQDHGQLKELLNAAKNWYEQATKIDPKYFEPQMAIAEMVYHDARKVKQEMNQLGITKEDQKKRYELDRIYVEKLKVALPLYVELEKLSPDEAKVLDTLLNIYTDLDNQAQMARIEKKMKVLGLLD